MRRVYAYMTFILRYISQCTTLEKKYSDRPILGMWAFWEEDW